MKIYCIPVLLVLTILLLTSCASGTPNTATVIASFNGNLIPVQQVVETGDSIFVRYQVDLALGPGAFKDDIPFILGTIARDYPASKTIRIDCFVGVDPVRFYEVKTADVIGYAQESRSGTQIAALIQPKIPDSTMKSGIQSMYSAQANSNGFFQTAGVLILALGQAGRSSGALLLAIFSLVIIAAAVVYAIREIRR